MTHNAPSSVIWSTALLGALFTVGCSPTGSKEDPSASHHNALAGAGDAIVGIGGKCLDDAGGETGNGTPIQLWTCNGTPAQTWAFVNGALVGPAEKCLDVSGGNEANDTPIQLYDCNETAAQQWRVDGGQLVGLGGKCLDASGARGEDGTRLVLRDCNGGPSQQWSVGMACGSPAGAAGGGVAPPPTTFACGDAPRAGRGPDAYPTGGRTFFVSVNGNDGNDGRSSAAAFRNVWRASSILLPGDTVLFGDGTYDGFSISASGTANAYIAYRAMPGQHPKLKVASTDAIYAVGVSFVVIDGFEVEGNRAAITYEYALAHPRASETSANGISFYGGHHIVIRNNVVHDVSGGGIGVSQADYVTIERNTTYRNAYWSAYGNSGISLGWATAIDDSVGTKNVIANNVSFGNEEFLNCLCSGSTVITDGNGIILDDFRHTEDGHPELAYRARTLVTNNLAYDNGGTGMHAFRSDHVDFINNTVFHNSHSPALSEQGLAASSSGDATFYNNIVVAADGKPGGLVGDDDGNAGYNLFFGGTGTPNVHPHDLVADPRFVNAECADFRPGAGSPAIDTGTSTTAPASDLLGAPRAVGAAVDRGVYEAER